MKLNIQLFAGGTITGSSTASIGRVQIVWTATASDAIENKSSVSASVQVKRSNAYNTTGTFSGTLWINGTAFSIKKKFDPISNSWKTVGSATLDVPHNEDGTKTIEIKTSFSNTGTSMAGTYTASANVALDTIPRASAFNSFSMSVNNDSSISVVASITKRNTSFTDTLNICNENITLSNGTNYITFSSSSHATAYNRFYALMGNQTQANYTAVLTTSSSGTQIGNTSAITAYNVALPSYALSVSAITSSDDNANVYIRSGSTHKVSDFTGTNTFLQGWSNPRLSYTLGATHNTLYGNLISITGATTKSGVGLGNDNFTLGTNFTGGTKTINATDGRKSASNSLTLTRKDWSTPSVSITLTRESATGTQVNWVVSWSYTNVSGGLTPKLNASYTYNGTTTTLISDRTLTSASGSLSGNFQLANADDYKYPISANANLTDMIDYYVISNIQIPGGLPAIYTYKDSGANNVVNIYGTLNATGHANISGNIDVNNATINGILKCSSFKNKSTTEVSNNFRNDFLSASSGPSIKAIRNDAGASQMPTYGAGIAFGVSDTHGYIMTGVFTPEVAVGGGNGVGLIWSKRLAFKDETLPLINYGNDFNNYTDASYGSVQGIINHRPGASSSYFYGSMIVLKHANNYIQQIAIDANTGLAYSRYMLNGTWKDWVGLNHTRKLTFNNEWYQALGAYGSGWSLYVPFNSPYGTRPTLSLTSCQYFGTAGWKNCTASIGYQSETTCRIDFSGITTSETQNAVVLVRMVGTLTL